MLLLSLPPRTPSSLPPHTSYPFPRSPAPTQMLLLSLSPRILLLESFLDQSTCDALRALATPRLTKSRVSTGE